MKGVTASPCHYEALQRISWTECDLLLRPRWITLTVRAAWAPRAHRHHVAICHEGERRTYRSVKCFVDDLYGLGARPPSSRRIALWESISCDFASARRLRCSE